METEKTSIVNDLEHNRKQSKLVKNLQEIKEF